MDNILSEKEINNKTITYMENILSEKEIILDKLNNNDDWNYYLNNRLITEDILEKYYQDIKPYMLGVLKYQNLSLKFLDKHSKDFSEMDWRAIAIHQTLSEDFMKKYNGKLNWQLLSCNQQMSEKFIIKHKKSVDWNLILKYQKISQKFINQFKDKFNKIYLGGSK